MAINRVWKPSPNYSAGYSSRRLITVHTSEGATTNQSLANFLTQASAKVSYSVSVDNVSGTNTCFEYVRNTNTPWSQAAFNSVAVTGCFCTPSGASSGWSRATWLNQSNALACMAKWVAEESARWNIPLVALTPSQAQGSGRGVCQHRDLGASGSNHTDCGAGFPMDELLRLAKGGSTPEPPKPAQPTDWSDYMGAIYPTPTIVPIPPGANFAKLVVAADPGNSNVVVRVALANNNDAGWMVKTFTLTADRPNGWVATEGHNIARMDIQTAGASAGYCFQA